MFRRTLFRLTLQYSVLLLALFMLFSAAIYKYMDTSADGADASLDQLKSVLLLSYVVLLVLLPLVSYLLARRALRPVQLSFAEQQRFVDDASHELRTPLSVLQGELELASSKPRTSREYRKAINSSLKEVERLTRLTGALLLLARGSHRQLVDSFENVSLDTLVTQQVALLKKRYGGKRLKISCRTEPVHTRAVSSLLGQGIMNILDNAAKYSGPSRTIHVTVTASTKIALITVVDDGPGLSTKEIDRAFDRFWRADRSRNVEGFGLGLALTQQIMRMHNGAVQLSSPTGHGTTVKLSLPLANSR